MGCRRAVLAIVLLLSMGAAAWAQPCADRITSNCLESLGAGSTPAPLPNCAAQLEAYRACLTEIIEAGPSERTPSDRASQPSALIVFAEPPRPLVEAMSIHWEIEFARDLPAVEFVCPGQSLLVRNERDETISLGAASNGDLSSHRLARIPPNSDAEFPISAGLLSEAKRYLNSEIGILRIFPENRQNFTIDWESAASVFIVECSRLGEILERCAAFDDAEIFYWMYEETPGEPNTFTASENVFCREFEKEILKVLSAL